MHGGSVSVTSDGPGRGSEISVRLPILTEKPQARPAHRPAREARALTARRILVVDDNADSAASLALLLKMSGNETATAHDGLAAVAAVEAFRPDVVLLDISLPKLDGHEAARCIRQGPWGKDIVLVALTGWGQDEDRRRSKEAGFDEHMVKPVDYEALMRLLASVR
jgi:CheY-like chemotaxis protein